MNRVGLVAAGVAASLALACGANPAVYLVALDRSALRSLPGSCYASGTPPATPPAITTLVQHEFTIWEGAQGKRYLEIDRVDVDFPTSDYFFSGLAEGGPTTWEYSATVSRANATTEVRTMTFSFSDLGATLLGSAAVSSACTCPTAPCACVDCSATLLLNGRQIEATGSL